MNRRSTSVIIYADTCPAILLRRTANYLSSMHSSVCCTSARCINWYTWNALSDLSCIFFASAISYCVARRAIVRGPGRDGVINCVIGTKVA